MTKKTLVLALALLMPFCAANASHDEYIDGGMEAPWRIHKWIDDETGENMLETQRLPDNANGREGYVKHQSAEEVEREKEARAQQKEAMEEMAKRNKFESAGGNDSYRFYRNPVTNQKIIIDRKTGEIKFQN